MGINLSSNIKTFEQYVSNDPDKFYIGKKNTIYIKPKFNSLINYELLKKYKKIIFANSYEFINFVELNLHNSYEVEESQFNQQIKLPDLVETISFGERFNQNIILPAQLKTIIFKEDFNKKIILPNSLVELSFELSFFNQPIELVDSLKVLFLSYNYNQTILLPESLEILSFGIFFGKSFNLLKLPNNLKRLNMGFNFTKLFDLPNTLNYLILDVKEINANINTNVNMNLINNCSSLLNNLPNSLEHLVIIGDNNFELANLPNGLRTIIFDSKYQHTNILNLPDSIETIGLSYEYLNQIIKLPKNLKLIQINHRQILTKKYIENLEKYNVITHKLNYYDDFTFNLFKI